MIISKEMQIKIFRYYDPYPPIPGTVRDAKCKLLIESNYDPEVIKELRECSDNMMKDIEKYVLGIGV